MLLPSSEAVCGFTGIVSKTADQVSPYPPETVLFTALPMLCISSPMPRTVAHPSEAKTTKNHAQRSNFFFFIFTSVRCGAASMPNRNCSNKEEIL